MGVVLFPTPEGAAGMVEAWRGLGDDQPGGHLDFTLLLGLHDHRCRGAAGACCQIVVSHEKEKAPWRERRREESQGGYGNLWFKGLEHGGIQAVEKTKANVKWEDRLLGSRQQGGRAKKEKWLIPAMMHTLSWSGLPLSLIGPFLPTTSQPPNDFIDPS